MLQKFKTSNILCFNLGIYTKQIPTPSIILYNISTYEISCRYVHAFISYLTQTSHENTYTNTHSHKHIYIYAHAQEHIYAHTETNTYMHTHRQTHIHTYTHTTQTFCGKCLNCVNEVLKHIFPTTYFSFCFRF